jgi:hypothetical protein
MVSVSGSSSAPGVAGELLVGGEHGAERVDQVLARFLAGPSLADRAGDFRNGRHDPAVACVLVM